MGEFFPLEDLQDPPVLLKGALLPITDLDPEHPEDRWFWLLDRLIRINGEDPLPPILERVQQIPLEGGEGLALDLSNEDTTRWADRKIAETLIARIMYGITVRSAVLGCTGDLFFLVCVGDIGQHTELALRPHGEFACLASITPTEANIPTVRAALLRALFGRMQ